MIWRVVTLHHCKACFRQACLKLLEREGVADNRVNVEVDLPLMSATPSRSSSFRHAWRKQALQ